MNCALLRIVDGITHSTYLGYYNPRWRMNILHPDITALSVSISVPPTADERGQELVKLSNKLVMLGRNQKSGYTFIAEGLQKLQQDLSREFNSSTHSNQNTVLNPNSSSNKGKLSKVRNCSKCGTSGHTKATCTLKFTSSKRAKKKQKD